MMLDVLPTVHGRMRMQQRGFRDDDVNLLLSLATAVADDAYMLTAKDAAREIARRKREIQQLERLCGSKVIVEDGRIITLYTDAAKPKRSKVGKCRRNP